MTSLSAILILIIIAFDHGSGFKLDHSISWPEEYHFNAETVDLVSSIVMPFEIWYSKRHGRSRIDLYGGVVKRYSSATRYGYSNVYMIHPETKGDVDVVMRCQTDEEPDDPKSFMPSVDGFTFSGKEKHADKVVHIWKKLTSRDERKFKVEDTLYLYQNDDDVSVPIKLITELFSLTNGALRMHTVTNFYNYGSKIKINDFIVARETCTAFSPLDQSFETSLKYLYPGIPSDVESAFRRYKKHHNKNYEDDEHELRKIIFENNWRYVEEHNRKNLSYKLELNEFADQTDEELQYLTGTRLSEPMKGTQPFSYSDEELTAIVQELPEDLDLRVEGDVSKVKNQARCGSCWAFAATASLEGALARANGGRHLDLSEQSIVDCAWGFDNYGCNGGFMNKAFEYVLKYGIPTESDYGPYLMQDGICHIKNITETFKIKGFVGVTPESPNALKAALYKYGPVTVGVHATKNMKFYSSGVFYDFRCEPGAMNHGVTVVGYGVRDGDLYWIVKNSWGENWGEDGYILMSATNDNCNILSAPYYPIV